MDDSKSVWLCLPDSLVLQIFTYLSSAELLRAAQSCKAWHRISKDELLWKALLYEEWKIDRCMPLPPGHTSFFREFRRLKCHVPCIEVQVLREHTDQVLHVSFSHNGKMFGTCSKDGTIKVWKTGPPISLKYSRAMKELFRWQYTQFSQFNACDTLLLVSGVHFGPNSTSGEIAVFNLKDDFALQARVLNKPYDIFGCWLNSSHLLSGNLHYLGHLSSCSALWLNKATQEVLSEQESVIMRLFKFLNINASSVRSITVANCRNLGKGEDYIKTPPQTVNYRDYDSSSHTGLNSSGPLPDSSESELEGRVGAPCSYMYESDTEMTASESEVGQSGTEGSRDLVGESMDPDQSASRALPKGSDTWPALHQSRSDPCLPSEDTDQARKARAIANINQLYQQQCRQQSHRNALASHLVQSSEASSDDATLAQARPTKQSNPLGVSKPKRSPVKRDVSDVSGTPPDVLRKSLRTEAAAPDDSQPSTSSGSANSAPVNRGPADTCYKSLWLRVRQAEMRRGGENYDEDLFRILIEGINPNYRAAQCEDHADMGGNWSTKGGAGKDVASSSNAGEASGVHQPLDMRESQNTVSSRCSSSDTVLSSPDCDHTSSLTFAAESSSASDIIRAWGKQFNFGSTESLDDEPSIHYPDRRRGFSDPELSRQHPGQRDALPQLRTESEEISNMSSSSMSDSQSQDYSYRTHKVRRRKLSPKEEHQHLIFTRGSQAYTPHQIGIKRIDSTMANTLKGPLGASCKPEETREGMGQDREPDQPGGVEFDKVDHVIELNGHAIGMALSPDHRYLYVNCRCWPRDYVISDPLTPPPIAQEIEIRVYDLINLTEVKRLHGHKAFSPNDEFNFIFLDVSDLYVASGAEDRQGYIWDRYYGILLAKLAHRDVVNSVAFNPRDPEMMITASDDHTLKVWFSHHKAMMAKEVGH
ncbi:F-box/WD repeat-containing protein 5-like isoform X2 [Asterias amurensis]